jgi:hypothetical protein
MAYMFGLCYISLDYVTFSLADKYSNSIFTIA